MCPASITTALLTAVGASSTGGLTALALKTVCWKSKRNHQTEETRQNEIEAMEYETTGISEVNPHKIVSKAERLVARKDLLKREKKLTHVCDEISRHRRELLRGKVEKNYVFQTCPGSRRITKPNFTCT